MELHIQSEEEIAGAARAIIRFSEDEKVWLFVGPLGAGKTTLIAAICRILGVEDVVSSPSFAIIHEYANTSGRDFYHFDFYRINDEEEAMRLGLEEYFDSGALCFIEWPDKVRSLVPDKHLQIHLDIATRHSRKIRVEKYG